MNSPATPSAAAKRHIGQILISQGILTEDQLRIALLEQMKSKLPVGKLLVNLGFVSEATLRDAQLVLGQDALRDQDLADMALGRYGGGGGGIHDQCASCDTLLLTWAMSKVTGWPADKASARR
jgi:hypothetical protein